MGEFWDLLELDLPFWARFGRLDLHECGRALGGVRESSGRGVGVGELWSGSGRAVAWEWDARLTRSTDDGSADSYNEICYMCPHVLSLIETHT